MRVVAHLAIWLSMLAIIMLALADYQRTHWCELPGWLGPDAVWGKDMCPRPGVIVVRALK